MINPPIHNDGGLFDDTSRTDDDGPTNSKDRSLGVYDGTWRCSVKNGGHTLDITVPAPMVMSPFRSTS